MHDCRDALQIARADSVYDACTCRYILNFSWTCVTSVGFMRTALNFTVCDDFFLPLLHFLSYKYAHQVTFDRPSFITAHFSCPASDVFLFAVAS